ncbi:hypothetical protein FA09DRAFT_327258 [Tilletiopsis washingtonensis]|jgi:hypothetical protein|uniref:Uncharacterized protein n=1 Tax=Tilletiopsis washingtonensis TaxID=58919 RepID=A0A316ZJK1_9BASI|nr:hypothetical protein FA09DRAFT_327258 [Tilletiopsis washingtonensis]PWO01309.1 hypothetical protein FA09DRAFT_327258 [Tilletiopsis washingtonensis]
MDVKRGAVLAALPCEAGASGPRGKSMPQMARPRARVWRPSWRASCSRPALPSSAALSCAWRRGSLQTKHDYAAAA